VGGKTGPNPTDRGKSGFKRSTLTDAAGLPLAVEVAGANRHDMKLTAATLADIVIKRPRPTRVAPQGLCLDKGYDYNEVRAIVAAFGFTAHFALVVKRPRPSKAKPASGRAAWYSHLV
jgi:hypothetical protein